MRRLTSRFALIAATLMVMAVPVIADDLSVVQPMEPVQLQDGKNECLLVAMNDCNRMGTFQDRIREIKSEINKGTTVYSEDELGVLQRKLDEQLREMNEAYQGS